MSDLEDRLTAALTEEADAAPPVHGLAAGARRRARTRRLRRATLGAALATAVVIGSAVAVAGTHASGRRTAPTTRPDAAAWTDRTLDGVTVSAPAGCATFDHVPAVLPDCFVQVAPGYEPVGSSGLYRDARDWHGSVSVGSVTVLVTSPDRGRTLSMLGSARPAGVGAPDASRGWTTRDVAATRFAVPVDQSAGVQVTVHETAVPPVGRTRDRQLPSGRWTETSTVPGPGAVTITAPTEAVLQLVLASAHAIPQTHHFAPVRLAWRTVRVGQAEVDVPKDCDLSQVTAATCGGLTTLTFRPIGPTDDLISYGEHCTDGGCDGLTTQVGDGTTDGTFVFAAGSSEEVVRDVVASLRRVGDQVPDLLSPWHIDIFSVEKNYGIFLPRGLTTPYGAQLAAPTGHDLLASQPVRGPAGWQVTHRLVSRPGEFVTVTAPTQALAEVIAASVPVIEG